jgi:hypothetical protein
MPKGSVLWVAVVALSFYPGSVLADWVAYNDCLRQNGDATAANVTGWTLHNGDQTHFTGPLVNFETGGDAGMPTVTFTMGGAGLQTSSGGSGGNFAPGTEAYEIFNGIVDFGPDLPYYGSSGWWVEIEFSGLDPGSVYTFIGTANRSQSYPTRVSLFTILDAVSFMNTSSAGVVGGRDDQTAGRRQHRRRLRRSLGGDCPLGNGDIQSAGRSGPGGRCGQGVSVRRLHAAANRRRGESAARGGCGRV